MDKDLALAYRKGFNSLVDYRRIFHGTPDDKKPAEFHYLISDILLNGKDNVAIEAARQLAKTTYIKAFCQHCLTYPRKGFQYIPIIKSNKTDAAKVIKQISDEFKVNRHQYMNITKIKEDSGDAFMVEGIDAAGKKIWVRFESYGKGSAVRGLLYNNVRPDIIIIDDPQAKEDSRSDRVQENDWEWFLSDIQFLGKEARIFLIGNNLGARCIIERLFKLEGNMEEVKFTCIRMPAMVDGKSSWEDMFPVQFLKNERKDYEQLGKLDIWLMERMCQAVGEETRLFRESDYNYYSPGLADSICGNGQVFATLDPASSKEDTACFRAIVVNCVMPDGHWYILEIAYGRWDTIELIEKIFYLVQRWGIRKFGVEKGQLQQAYESLLWREMSIRNIRFELEGLEHGKIGNKLDRIRMLQPRFKSHSVWFPDHAYWLEELKSELGGVTNHEIKSEFIDLVDALAMQDQFIISPYVQTEANKKRTTQLPRRAIA